MAIQNRRGQYSDFDPTKAVAGEMLVVQEGDPNATDGKAVYMAFSSGSVKRLATYEDMVENIEEATSEIAEDLATEINAEVADNVTAAQTASQTATAQANIALGYATSAEASADEAAELVANLYGDVTVGNAEQLVTDIGIIDTEPYLFRRATKAIGNRLKEKLIGATVAFNQLVQNGNFANTNAWSAVASTFSVANNIGTFVRTSTPDQLANFSIDVIKDHLYLISAKMRLSVTGTVGFSNVIGFGNANIVANTWTQIAFITRATASYTSGIERLNASGEVGTVLDIANACLFDLTQMFGTEIADRLYTLEQTTAGSGVALFRKLFPKLYYPYNPGELLSVSGLVSHDEVGFNQWDEEWEQGSISTTTGVPYTSNSAIRSKNFCRCLGDTVYNLTHTVSKGLTVLWYDSNKNYISADGTVSDAHITKTSPSNAAYFKIVYQQTSYDKTICINLSWDGERNGTYEPYVKHSYPLDDSLTLRGLFKLDANDKWYAEGDEYESEGKKTNRYALVDLGTLNYSKYDVAQGTLFRGYISNIKQLSQIAVPNCICSKYSTIDTSSRAEKTISQATNLSSIDIIDSSYTDAATFKTAMSGVKLVYEKATPTVSEAQPFVPYQTVSKDGTEQYVTDSIVPVGHETLYLADLREDIENLLYSGNVDATTKPNRKADAISDTAKGAVASFPDGADNMYVKDLKVKLSPVQDLHGYDHPWPAGGGKNFAHFSTALINTDRSQNNVTFHAISESEVRITTSGTASGNAYATTGDDNEMSLKAGTYTISTNLPSGDNTRVYITSSKSGFPNIVAYNGHPVTFTISEDHPNTNLQIAVGSGMSINSNIWVQIESGSSATSYAPYSNICPISGLDEVEVKRTGKNVWDEETVAGYYNGSTGAFVSQSNTMGSKNPISVKPNTTYYLKSGTYNINVNCYRADMSPIIQFYHKQNSTFTTPSDCYFINISNDFASGATYNHDICINISDPDKNGTYEPYHGTELTSSLPETVYGGTLDLTTGELVVDRVSEFFDSSDSYYTTGINTVYFVKLSNQAKNSLPYGVGSVFDRFKSISKSFADYVLGDGEIYNNRFYFYKPTTAGSGQAYIQSIGGVQVCYTLATPVTYHLTPKQLATFKGYNNIWANGNSEVDVEYYADTKLYIEKLTKPTEDDMIANQNIPSGKFFMVGNSLYLSTSAIASGETIVVGTNCTAVSLADALNTLNS